MNPYQVLLQPLLSEKSLAAKDRLNQYWFAVSRMSNKTEIKRAVQKMFDVKVAKVQTMVLPGKVKRRGLHELKASNMKRAVVTLVEGQKIKMFEDQ